MVSHERHVGREKCLILIVNANADIGPPQKCLREGRPVVQPDLRFHNALPGGRQIPTMPFIRCIGSCSLSQTVTLPSALLSIACCTGI